MENKRYLGGRGEDIVIDYYKNEGYSLIKKNFTVRGGEIDIILEKNGIIFFIEVKVVDQTEDLYGYITQKKLKTLKKTINYYIYHNDIRNDYLFHVVFVKNNEIIEIYTDIDFDI